MYVRAERTKLIDKKDPSKGKVTSIIYDGEVNITPAGTIRKMSETNPEAAINTLIEDLQGLSLEQYEGIAHSANPEARAWCLLFGCTCCAPNSEPKANLVKAIRYTAEHKNLLKDWVSSLKELPEFCSKVFGFSFTTY